MRGIIRGSGIGIDDPRCGMAPITGPQSRPMAAVVAADQDARRRGPQHDRDGPCGPGRLGERLPIAISGVAAIDQIRRGRPRSGHHKEGRYAGLVTTRQRMSLPADQHRLGQAPCPRSGAVTRPQVPCRRAGQKIQGPVHINGEIRRTCRRRMQLTSGIHLDVTYPQRAILVVAEDKCVVEADAALHPAGVRDHVGSELGAIARP